MDFIKDFLLKLIIYITPPIIMVLLAFWGYRVKKQREKKIKLKWQVEDLFSEDPRL